MIPDYNQTIGYSPLESVDVDKMRKVIKINKEIIGKYYSLKRGDLILVAGPGRGDEVVILNQEFGNKTFGLDLNIARLVLWENNPDVISQRQDITALVFCKAVFSLVYSYHVIEHVSIFPGALGELHLVMKPGGVLFIGFPNKNRLFSYIGMSQRASGLKNLNGTSMIMHTGSRENLRTGLELMPDLPSRNLSKRHPSCSA